MTRTQQQIADDLAEITERIQATEQFIARHKEQIQRAEIRKSYLLIEKADLLLGVPSTWVAWSDMPAHWGDFARNTEEAGPRLDESTSQLITAHGMSAEDL